MSEPGVDRTGAAAPAQPSGEATQPSVEATQPSVEAGVRPAPAGPPPEAAGPDTAQSTALPPPDVAVRQILVRNPIVRFNLGPGDRVLVKAGDRVEPGTAIAELTPDAELVEVGKLGSGSGPRRANGSGPRGEEGPLWREETAADASRRAHGMASATETRGERRQPPAPGKWWVGGAERRGKPAKSKPAARVAGTLLFERAGIWRAAAGERHEIVESPVIGIVREARNAYQLTIETTGSAIPGVVGAGQATRGYLDVPRLTDGELWAAALDTGRSGAIVIAGSRISAQAISRARAMSIRGLVAGSIGQGELRDLEASLVRQKASLAPAIPFGLIALDGHQRRPLPTPVLALLAALAGREVAIVTDPPLLVFDVADVPLPELPPDWIRARSGPHAGREGRYLEPAGLHRFRSGVHLPAAVVRFVDETATTIVPVADLERFVY